MIACLYGPPPPSSSFRRDTTSGATVVTRPKGLPDGVELTLSELQEMASRQQQQIESQQQMLVAKEQRVKFLKQQELRQQELAAENERLRRLRERVETQELKLQKLKALRGQVDQQKINNSTLSTELDSVRSLFNAKEKELSVAVAKVEQLTKQLEELRRGRVNGLGGGARTCNLPAAIELEKLRQELMYRNKLNEQQSNKLVEQREVLNQRTEEMSRIDRRIAELQQRLHRKRLLNQQLASQINAATAKQQVRATTTTANQRNHLHGGGSSSISSAATPPTNVAAVEPFQHVPPPPPPPPLNDATALLLLQDDDFRHEELSEFHLNKSDPKYQTLPYNTKFSSSTKYGGAKSGGDDPCSDKSQVSPPSPFNQTSRGHGSLPPGLSPPQTVHSIPAYAPAKALAVPVDPPEVQSLPASKNTANGYGARNYPGSAYPGSSALSRTQFQDTSGAKMVAPPYIPPPPSTMHKASSLNGGGGSAEKSDVLQHHHQLPPPHSKQQQNFRAAPEVLHEHPRLAASNGLRHHHQGATSTVLLSLETSTAQVAAAAAATDSYSSSAAEGIGAGGSGSDVVPKPALPPKPCIPQKPTPPPRQIHSVIERSRAAAGLDTSPEAIDSALSVLHSSAQAAAAHRYASKSVIANTYTRKVNNNGVLDQYLKSVTKLYGGTGEADGIEVHQDVPRKSGELPIKPRPLTIKKQTGVEPPKLRAHHACPPKKESTAAAPGVQRPHQGLAPFHNRRIEIPPAAFLFPEAAAVAVDPMATDTTDQAPNDEGAALVQSPVAAADADAAEDFVAKVWPPADIKRRPLVIGGSGGFDGQCLLDDNGSDLGSGGDAAVDEAAGVAELEDSSERQGPVGGSSTTEEVAAVDVTRKEEEAVEEDHGGSAPDDVVLEDASSSQDIASDSPGGVVVVARRTKKGNLKTKNSSKTTTRRVSFDPLALLLDAALEGELELVKKTAQEVPNPSAANDEGITALHNAICAGHYEIVKFLVEFGCDVNAQDSDGWTPLHCAASCNNLPMVKFLVEHGACIFATTLSDHETAAEKCEEDEEGFDGCTEFLYSIQEKLGILNNGVVYALYDYEAQSSDELGFRDTDVIVVLRKGDEFEREWWWSKVKDREGYIPRNLLGLYPRVATGGTAVATNDN